MEYSTANNGDYAITKQSKLQAYSATILLTTQS